MPLCELQRSLACDEVVVRRLEALQVLGMQGHRGQRPGQGTRGVVPAAQALQGVSAADPPANLK